MALTFGANVTDRVDCGSGSSLTTLTAGTYLTWTYPTSVANVVKNLSTKLVAGATAIGGWEFFKRAVDGTSLRFYFNKTDTTNAINIVSNTGILAVNAWHLVGVTWQEATAASCKIYGGTLTTSVADVTSSATASGSCGSDAGQNMLIGNNTPLTGAWDGAIAWTGVWNRVLSLGEIKDQQFHPHVTSGCVLFMHLGYAGTGTQPDWSGNANAGTVTGATVSAHVPLRPPFGARTWNPYAVAAAGTFPFRVLWPFMQGGMRV